MELLNEKVEHKSWGSGVITEINGSHITIQFEENTIRFVYPDAFERYLVFVDENKQDSVLAEISRKKQDEEKQKCAKEAARAKAIQERGIPSDKKKVVNKKSKTIDEMFSEDYHAIYLARHPILTYEQVEKQFGIQIAGFGKGINSTETAIVLISSIGKTKGKFTYHDRWTKDGDYVYSGEGKNGDQTLTKGNAAIKNAEVDGKMIHLFVKFSPSEYYYQGVFRLIDVYTENEKDETGKERKEYKFKLHKEQQ